MQVCLADRTVNLCRFDSVLETVRFEYEIGFGLNPLFSRAKPKGREVIVALGRCSCLGISFRASWAILFAF